MSVFVYPLPSRLTGEYLYDNVTADDHDFHFRGELELTQRLREMPQADPATADMLLVPFMLVQAFTKLRKGLRSPGHAQLMRWDGAVVAWGHNWMGQLGIGGGEPRFARTPQVVELAEGPRRLLR